MGEKTEKIDEKTEKMGNITGKMGNKLNNVHMTGKISGEMGILPRNMGDRTVKMENMTK